MRQIGRRISANTDERIFGPLAGGGLVALPRLVGELAEPTIPFDGELIADRGTVPIVGDAGQLYEQLLERQRRVHDHGLHVGEVLEPGIEIDRIEDAEASLPISSHLRVARPSICS